MDPRIEHVVQLLHAADLSTVPARAREPQVGAVLSRGLGPLVKSHRPAVGIDGSGRQPDDARIVSVASSDGIHVAIEYKLYRTRGQGAGEMDRALGQCIAYAENYDAVLLYVVYMGRPREPIPGRWTDRSNPLNVGTGHVRIPVYFAARPRCWTDSWAGSFSESRSGDSARLDVGRVSHQEDRRGVEGSATPTANAGEATRGRSEIYEADVLAELRRRGLTPSKENEGWRGADGIASRYVWWPKTLKGRLRTMHLGNFHADTRLTQPIENGNVRYEITFSGAEREVGLAALHEAIRLLVELE